MQSPNNMRMAPVSRVKLPPPGSGMVKVVDRTAGSGRARPGGEEPVHNAAAQVAAVSAAMTAAANEVRQTSSAPPNPMEASLPRRVRTPEMQPRGSSASSRAQGLRRSSSAGLARSLAVSESASRSMTAPFAASGSLPPVAAGDQLAPPTMPAEVGQPAIGGLPGGSLPSNRDGVEPPVVSSGSPTMDRPPLAPDRAGMARSPSAIEPSVRHSSAGRGRGSGSPSQEAPRHRSRPPPQPAPARSRSEPPRRDRSRGAARAPNEARAPNVNDAASVAGNGAEKIGLQVGGGRLGQLVAEVTSHFRCAPMPVDGKQWLEETAQLELYLEELRWLVGEHPENRGRLAQEPIERPKHELSVMRGDKDLRWARQQLRYCEKEHAHLQQLLNIADPEVHGQQLAELRAVEDEIEAEQKRQKQLVSENRQRERSLSRGVVDGRDMDGNARAIQQIERLEAELAVWKVKNESKNGLRAQVEDAEMKLRRAQENQEALGLKAQQVEELLSSEDHQAWMAEQRQKLDRENGEEAEMQRKVADLQEGRKRAAQQHVRVCKERAKEFSALDKQYKELEAKRTHLYALENQLRRQVRQQQLGLPPRRTPGSSPLISARSQAGAAQGSTASHSPQSQPGVRSPHDGHQLRRALPDDNASRWSQAQSPHGGATASSSSPRQAGNSHNAPASPQRSKPCVGRAGIRTEDALMRQIKTRLTAAAYSLGGVNWPKLFLFYDRDGCGTISLNEFRSLIRKDAKVTAKMLSDEMLEHLYWVVDEDKSGLIAYREFLTWLELTDELERDAACPSAAPNTAPTGSAAERGVGTAQRVISPSGSETDARRRNSPKDQLQKSPEETFSQISAECKASQARRLEGRGQDEPRQRCRKTESNLAEGGFLYELDERGLLDGDEPRQRVRETEEQAQQNALDETELAAIVIQRKIRGRLERQPTSLRNKMPEAPTRSSPSPADAAAGSPLQMKTQQQQSPPAASAFGTGTDAIETEMSVQLRLLEEEAAATARAATEIQRRLRGNIARSKGNGSTVKIAPEPAGASAAEDAAGEADPVSPSNEEAVAVLQAELNRTNPPSPSIDDTVSAQGKERRSQGPGRPPFAGNSKPPAVAKAKAPPGPGRSRSNSNASAASGAARGRSPSVNSGQR